MKHLIRLLAFVLVWAVVSAIVMTIIANVQPLEAAEGAEVEAAWNWWLGLSIGLLLTIAIALGAWVYNRRRHANIISTDLRGGE